MGGQHRHSPGSENDWPGEQPDRVHRGAVNTNGVLSLEAAADAASG